MVKKGFTPGFSEIAEPSKRTNRRIPKPGVDDDDSMCGRIAHTAATALSSGIEPSRQFDCEITERWTRFAQAAP
jgi:hypothetical protein